MNESAIKDLSRRIANRLGGEAINQCRQIEIELVEAAQQLFHSQLAHLVAEQKITNALLKELIMANSDGFDGIRQALSDGQALGAAAIALATAANTLATATNTLASDVGALITWAKSQAPGTIPDDVVASLSGADQSLQAATTAANAALAASQTATTSAQAADTSAQSIVAPPAATAPVAPAPVDPTASTDPNAPPA